MRRESGVTLLELLVAMALFGALAAAGAGILGTAVRLAAAAARWAEAEHHARSVVERLSLQLRAAGYGSEGTRFVVADRSRVEFLADFDPEVPGPELHGFYLGRDGVLRERSGEGRFALTTTQDGFRVVSFQLAYFDRVGRELGPLPLVASQREEVVRVRIQMAYGVTDNSRRPRTLETEAHVAVRTAVE